MEEKQTNYTIAEAFYLPSEGKIYDRPVDQLIELRSMTGMEEMKRQSPSVAQFKVLADIIEDCLLQKPAVHVYDMALGDYEFLLHKLRIVTYGDEYKIILNCPSCGEQVETVAHLDELEINRINMEEVEQLRTFTLPKSGHTVTIKFQTPRMLDEINVRKKELERKFKGAEINFTDYIKLQQIIDTVDGEKPDSVKLENFINKLPALDTLKILNNMDKLSNSFGVDTRLFVNCPLCGHDITTFFRFGPEFFRPTGI